MTTDLLRSYGYDPRGPGADRRYGNVPDTATRDAVADALEEARQAWSVGRTPGPESSGPCAPPA